MPPFVIPPPGGSVDPGDIATAVENYLIANPPGDSAAIANIEWLDLSDDWQAAYDAATVPTLFIHAAGVYEVSATLALPGEHTYSFYGTTVAMADDANLDAVVATSSWLGSSEFVDEPLTILGLRIEGNTAENATGANHGLVVRAYRPTMRDIYVNDVRGDGIRLTSITLDLTSASGTMVEAIIADCRVFKEDIFTGACYRIADDEGTARVTDGYLTSCIAYGGEFGLLATQSGGWHIDGFHSYACGYVGMYVFNPNATRISNIYLEGWGTPVGWRVGLWLSGIQDQGVTVVGGCVHNLEADDGTSIGILAAGAAGADAQLIAHLDIDTNPDSTSTAFVIEGGGSGGQLTYNIVGSTARNVDTRLSTSGTVIDEYDLWTA